MGLRRVGAERPVALAVALMLALEPFLGLLLLEVIQNLLGQAAQLQTGDREKTMIC